MAKPNRHFAREGNKEPWNSFSFSEGLSSAAQDAAKKSQANRQYSIDSQKQVFGWEVPVNKDALFTLQKNNEIGSNLRYDRAGLKGKKGWAKKGGGGHGRFTWGKFSDDLALADPVLRKDDPNYDSYEEEDVENHVIFDLQQHHAELARRTGISLESFNGGGYLTFSSNYSNNLSSAAIAPKSKSESDERVEKISLGQFRLDCIEMLNVFFVDEDFLEIATELVELRSSLFYYEFVRRAITLAMERNSRERELVSRLLSELYGRRVIAPEQFGKGFERLLELVDDLILDIPMVKKYLSQFLARAVADEILPPSFICDPLIVRLGGEVIEHSKILLSIKHGLVRLNNVWGTTSCASVQELKNETKMILQEFLNSSDIDEACRCIKRLNVPFFHHEVVKRAIVLSLDCREREQAMMSSLLAELDTREIVSNKQMETGFRKLFEALPDLELDVPGAKHILDVFLAQAVKDGCISRDIAKSISPGV